MSQCTSKISWLALVATVTLFFSGCSFTAENFSTGVMDSPSETVVVRESDPFVLKGREILTTLDPLTEAPVDGATAMGWLLTGVTNVRLQRPTSLGSYGHFLYIVDAGEKVVFRYNVKLNTLEKISAVEAHLAGEPTNIFVREDGGFLLTDPSASQVHWFSFDGDLLRTYKSPGNLSLPVDVIFDKKSQQIYVADGAFSHIVVFSIDGEALYAIGMRGKGPGYFHRITALNFIQDEIFVLDSLALPLQVLTNKGDFKYAIDKSSLISPTAVAVDKSGRIFTSDNSDNYIKIFQNKKLLAKFGGGGRKPGKFRQMTDMTLIGDILYVADSQNGRVQRLKVDLPFATVEGR